MGTEIEFYSWQGKIARANENSVPLFSRLENVLPEPPGSPALTPSAFLPLGFAPVVLGFCSVLKALWVCEAVEEILSFLQFEVSRIPCRYPCHPLDGGGRS